MTDPVTFASVSPRFALPLLYSGQAQKETFVNEAFALADALLHCSIESEAASPPASPADGQNWLVAAGATGEWAGHEGALASRQAGNWIFIPPRDGLRVLDLSSAQDRVFLGTWRKAPSLSEPIGGTTVDSEARAVIGDLIMALRGLGIFPSV
ncbi:DUF2793 domain-containing protein [Novosphingobium mangrovi (ex Huang et al. 2023)]|uniref:DUF2793 domain-containing protein n=1 Tax=Novosphingobium mangrovi (ex Huang et al. 2023) TaxID=2976432 RepID=A0ABT2I315_9SPHN|nr:DUF2793 domain-containing protein [Novosphingobium mangrovi (ex Huang et al. 2023)]MCT2399194.1 DUF2793 domain-containing protein [Novosphingobium mangrovi (ex Huang et al. 2023)]